MVGQVLAPGEKEGAMAYCVEEVNGNVLYALTAVRPEGSSSVVSEGGEESA